MLWLNFCFEKLSSWYRVISLFHVNCQISFAKCLIIYLMGICALEKHVPFVCFVDKGSNLSISLTSNLVNLQLIDMILISITYWRDTKKYYAFQFKTLRFRLVLIATESYCQVLSFVFGIGPKTKMWFRWYTVRNKCFFTISWHCETPVKRLSVINIS